MKTQAHPLCRILTMVGMLALASISRGTDVIAWEFANSGMYFSYDITNQTTNGLPVSTNQPSYDGGLTSGIGHTLAATLEQSRIGINAGIDQELSTMCDCRQDLWAGNQPGQIGPVTITVTPLFSIDQLSSHGYYSASLSISQNGNLCTRQQYLFYLDSVMTNSLETYTFSVNPGDQVTFDLDHFDVFYSSGSGSMGSTASYALSVSTNGYLTNAVQSPVNLPRFTSVFFTNASPKLLTLSGTGGPSNAQPYYVITATNAATPLSAWTVCQTNNFDTNGGFVFSFPVNAGEPQRYIQLKIAQ